jgi:dienelactone hydrolase
MKISVPGFVLLLLPLAASSQDYTPPPVKKPEKTTLLAIVERTTQLDRAVSMLSLHGVRDSILADIEVYLKAAQWIQRHDEYFDDKSGQWTLDALDRGLLRATLAARGETPWLNLAGRPVVRAFRSRVDGSLQPYAVTLPKDYGRDPKMKWRLDVVLHGRDPSLGEVKFLHEHDGDKPAEDQPFAVLEIFGRGNNAYRWAGETDVFEAMEALAVSERFMGRDLFDPRRVVMRGFSMGGAGTWHLGLHRPDRWCVIGPGAGFTTTHGYAPNLPEKLPDPIEKCLHIYDAVDYAENAANVPVVAYAGEKDKQLQAARNIEAVLKPKNIPMILLVGPGLEHKFPDEWKQKAEAEYVKFGGPDKGRAGYPERVHFVTYTLKYPTCDWAELMNLEEHYRRAEIDATRVEGGFKVKTTNVRTLRLGLPGGELAPQLVQIDDQEVVGVKPSAHGGGQSIFLERRGGQWAATLLQKVSTDRARRLEKTAGLQGPIDDAFMDAFLCVRGSGKYWHGAIENYVEADLRRFQKEWNKFMRGDLPVKDDVNVTDDDIATKHLILFGDPSSNSLIAQVLDRLPLTWTKESLTVGGKSYDSSSHLPALIYASPLNQNKYVVINSGHTFHTYDFTHTNALLYPRLGDYAVLKTTPTEQDPLTMEVAVLGLFDDSWKIPAK